jgi:hypothetical protein
MHLATGRRLFSRQNSHELPPAAEFGSSGGSLS